MTKEFTLTASERTPHISGSVEIGEIRIRGKCCPEDCAEYFNTFINWMKLFHLTESEKVLVEIELEYINTSSSLILFRLLKDLKSLAETKAVEIIWKYDPQDNDMYEVAKDFQYTIGDLLKIEPSKTINKAS